MVELRTLTRDDAVTVTTNMRRQDVDCLHAVSDGVDHAQFGSILAASEGYAWSLFDDGQPVALLGVKVPVPWIGVGWVVCTDGMSTASWKKLIRHARIVLGNASKRLRRVECHVLGTWAEALLFAQRIGFEVESVRHNAGRDGQDLLTMVYKKG